MVALLLVSPPVPLQGRRLGPTPALFRRYRLLATIAIVEVPFFVALASLIRILSFVGVWILEILTLAQLRILQNFIVFGVMGLITLFVGVLIATAVVLLSAGRFMRSQGLETFELRRISRAFMHGPTADMALWRRPELARLLLPPAGAGARNPASPSEYPEAIAGVVAGMTTEHRLSGERVTAVARQLASAIAELDTQIAQLTQDFEPDELWRLDSRIEALGPDSAAQAAGRRELRRLLGDQRRLMASFATRVEAAKARRADSTRLLDELWRGVRSDRPERGASLEDVVSSAEAFVGPAVASAHTSPEEATRERPLP